MKIMHIEQKILDLVKEWLRPTFDQNTQTEIEALMTSDPKGLEDAFYKNLEFGTGGMRGIMGVGTNRINKYTLGKNTQGLSNYLKKCFPNEDLKVAIAYDCRKNSDTLAKIVADIFSANGIKVYLFSELRPTPELSFALKHLNCHAGIVLTASHNPPEYNGYKVYWQDGGQIVPPQDAEIIAEIAKTEQVAEEKEKQLLANPDTSSIKLDEPSEITDALADSTDKVVDDLAGKLQSDVGKEALQEVGEIADKLEELRKKNAATG
jgi:phosphomannomutase